MKLQNLQLPIGHNHSQSVIHNRLWFVPKKENENDSFLFPGWNHTSLFPNSNKLHIEYCSGNGSWIIDRAKAHPGVNWVAIEQRFDRARKIWTKLHNCGLQNLLVAWAEGYTLTKMHIPDSSVDEVSINFPDPWPKRRHAKYRIIQPLFIEEMHRILVPKGMITIVTDDESYSNSIIRTMLNHHGFTSGFQDPYFCEPSSEYGSSFFDQLFRGQGKIIRLHQFIKS